MPPKAPSESNDASPSSSPRVRSSHTSRNPSISSVGRTSHAPVNPSGLRATVIAGSPEERVGASSSREHGERGEIRPSLPHLSSAQTDHADSEPQGDFYADRDANVRSRLLDAENWDQMTGCGSDNCGHGTYSPRPQSPHGGFGNYGSFGDRFGDLGSGTVSPNGYGGRMPNAEGDATQGLLGGGSRMSTTKWLAQRHGVKDSRTMCVYPL